MSRYAIPLSQQAIIQFVSDKHYPSKQDILNHLGERDLATSSRNLDRYLGAIRADFGLELKYCRRNRGYYIDEEQSVRVDSFFKYLELVPPGELQIAKDLMN